NEALAGGRGAAQVSAMVQLFRLDRALIGVSGPDAVSFLNNLLTQSVEGLQAPRYSALLSPQGKVIADMMLWAHENGVLIEASVERGADLMRRLAIYKLRAQVSVSDVGAALAVVWSDERFEGANADPRFPNGALGYRELAPRNEATALADAA